MKTITDVRKIERVPVPLTHVDDVEAELRGQVLAEAFNNFGYAADGFGAVGSLAKTLATLGIAPLDREQVEAYMKMKERVEERCFGMKLMMWMSTVIAVAAAAFALFWRHAPEFMRPESGVVACWEFIRLAVIGAFASMLVAGIATDYKIVKTSWTWHMFSLGKGQGNGYPRYVPVHVLNYANLIIKELPSAQFTVHELYCEEVHVADPFLAVQLGSEKYWIAVWDEKEYEARM